MRIFFHFLGGVQCYLCMMEWKLLMKIFTNLYCGIVSAYLNTSLILNFAPLLELIYWHVFSMPPRDLT